MYNLRSKCTEPMSLTSLQRQAKKDCLKDSHLILHEIFASCGRSNLQTQIQKELRQRFKLKLCNIPNLYSSHLSDTAPNANEEQSVFLLSLYKLNSFYNKRTLLPTSFFRPFHCWFLPLPLGKVLLWSSDFKWLKNKEGFLRNKEFSRITKYA